MREPHGTTHTSGVSSIVGGLINAIDQKKLLKTHSFHKRPGSSVVGVGLKQML